MHLIHQAPTPDSLRRGAVGAKLDDAQATPPGIHALRELLAEQLEQRRPFDVLTLMIDDYAVVLGSFGWRVANILAGLVSSTLDLSTCRFFQLASDSYALVILDRAGSSLIELGEIVQKVVADAQRGMRQHADVSISVSIGMLAVKANTQADPDHLVDQALAAGFVARARSRHGIAIVESEAELEAKLAPLRWVMRIRQAIEHDRLVLFAQPIRPLRAGHAGPPRQEILVRLRDSTGSLWAPGEFLPIADRYGLTPDIDKWVIKNTFKWLARQGHAGRRGAVNTSINLSGLTIIESGLVDYVQQQLDASRVRPDSICFEITESVGIDGFPQATSSITELRRRGLRFALDDFGSGMASLKYLRDLPLDYLKIDGSFVRNVVTNPSNQYLVGAIRDMGRAFGLETIAEYVEDEATIGYLTDAGIDYAQGYAIGKPVPLGEGVLALRG
jgi:EAL domain-containing protein (putative c-di-GMP-specific phosphodiesterase class I)